LRLAGFSNTQYMKIARFGDFSYMFMPPALSLSGSKII
jgi:hypothetical protein